MTASASTAAVGVIGRATDPHAAAVARHAADRGATVRLIDTMLPEFGRWRWQDGRLLDHDGAEVRLAAAYVRAVAVPVPVHRESVVDHRELAGWLATTERGRRSHLHARSVHAGLESSGTLMVNSVDATWFHRSKPAADLRLRAAGIRTPRCLVTDRPEAVREFVDTVGETVTKPIAGGGECVAVDPARLTDTDLAGLRTAPALFQERVRGDDLRIYVVDGEVVAATHIKTEALDYRGKEDDVIAIAADDELAALSRAVAVALGLVFTGIDIKRGVDGLLTVLDANPSPMFLGIENRTGLPITARLADRLVAAGA
ncbi:ATP-grasp domain-containing protein [Pseudonocardia sp. GCM10023141]|uniref:ATP-grasp domain-containing protein n=1 Tax=Pseudonocardia sp. GCM10023141 TaxID=3252653 RepID=UPI003621F6D2